MMNILHDIEKLREDVPSLPHTHTHTHKIRKKILFTTILKRKKTNKQSNAELSNIIILHDIEKQREDVETISTPLYALLITE